MGREKSCPDLENRASLREIYSLIQCPLLWGLNYFSDCFLSPLYPRFQEGKIFYQTTRTLLWKTTPGNQRLSGATHRRRLGYYYVNESLISVVRIRPQNTSFILRVLQQGIELKLFLVILYLQVQIVCLTELTVVTYSYLIGRNTVGTPSGTYLNFPREQHKQKPQKLTPYKKKKA